MRHLFMNGLFLALLASTGALAGGQQGNAMKREATQQMKAIPLTDGVVKKVDPKSAKVTLQHGDIPGVMPAMTMSYRVKQAQQLESIRAGDKVRFAMEMLGGDYIVTHIEAAG